VAMTDDLYEMICNANGICRYYKNRNEITENEYKNRIKKSINDITEQEWDKMRAVDKQVGGSHYKKFIIQPAEFCYKNNIPYLEATAIKYLCRWRDKGGIQDLEKAKHFIDLLIEFENADT
jgi:hypothetical protein